MSIPVIARSWAELIATLQQLTNSPASITRAPMRIGGIWRCEVLR